MFAPHTSQIVITRSEPEKLDLEKAIAKVQRRNYAIAQLAVTKYRLRSPHANKAKGQAKVKELWERELRLPYLKSFIESYNHWRTYYDPREYRMEWTPKNRAQISLVENIVEVCKKEDIDLDIFIASSFKAFAKSKIPLPLNFLSSHGLEFFDRYSDEVQCDRDTDEQNRIAEG